MVVACIAKEEIRVRSVEKHSQEGTAEPQISPLRCASVEMSCGDRVSPIDMPSLYGSRFSSPWPLAHAARRKNPGSSVRDVSTGGRSPDFQ